MNRLLIIRVKFRLPCRCEIFDAFLTDNSCSCVAGMASHNSQNNPT